MKLTKKTYQANKMRRSRAPSQTGAKRTKTSTTLAKRKSAVATKTKILSQPRFGFPLQMQCTLRYVDFLSITSAAGVIGVQKFRCNGMFDPNQSGTGHQPMYFDTLMSVYDHYTVLQSKLTVRFVQPASLTTTSYVAVHIDDDTTTPTTLLATAEQSTASDTVLQATDNTTHRLVKYWDAKKYFGPDPLDNDNLQGTSSADPVEQSIYCITYSNSAVTSTLEGLVEIEYTAVFDELKTQEVH